MGFPSHPRGMKRSKNSRKNLREGEEADEGLTPFLLAVEKGKLNDIKSLLTGDPGVINDQSSHNQTPFHIATKRGNLAVVEFLFTQPGLSKTLVNAKDSKGMTCLHLAACGSNHELVMWLLKNDLVNIKAKVKDDETTLHLLAKFFPVVQEEVVKILLLVCVALVAVSFLCQIDTNLM